jgi:hypothetical protein
VSDETEDKRISAPVRVSHKVEKWLISRATNRLIESNPQLAAPEYRARVRRYVRISILLERMMDAFGPDVPMLNDRGELHDSYDMIRRFAETVTKLEKHLYQPIPRTERQAKSLDQLRAEADAADAEDEEPSET